MNDLHKRWRKYKASTSIQFGKSCKCSIHSLSEFGPKWNEMWWVKSGPFGVAVQLSGYRPLQSSEALWWEGEVPTRFIGPGKQKQGVVYTVNLSRLWLPAATQEHWVLSQKVWRREKKGESKLFGKILIQRPLRKSELTCGGV